MTHPEILVVGADRDPAFGLRTDMVYEGYRVTLANNGTDALDALRNRKPELMVLHLTLPGMDGYSVLRTLREEGCRLPVLILPTRDEEADKILGSRAGADDHATRPFGVMELMARLDALLRRSRISGTEEPASGKGPLAKTGGSYRFGAVVVDAAARVVTRDGEKVSLAPKEFDLLVALIRRRGAAVSRAALLRDVWHLPATTPTRTVDTHIGELRRKLEDDSANPRHLITVRKVGYRFQD